MSDPTIGDFFWASFNNSGAGLEHLAQFLDGGVLPRRELQREPGGMQAVAAVLMTGAGVAAPLLQREGALQGPLDAVVQFIDGRPGVDSGDADDGTGSDQLVIVDSPDYVEVPEDGPYGRPLGAYDPAVELLERMRVDRAAFRSGEAPRSGVTTADTNQVVLLGDSLLSEADVAAQEAFAAVDDKAQVTVIAKSGMPLSYQRCTIEPLSDFCKRNIDGLRAVQNEPVIAYSDSVVVALGRNAVERTPESDEYIFALDEVVNEIRSQTLRSDGSYADVFVVTLGSGPGDEQKQTADFRNQQLRSFAAALRVNVIPWDQEAEKHPEYFAADGIHLTAEGTKAYTSFIASRVEAMTAARQITEGERVELDTIVEEIPPPEEPVELDDIVPEGEGIKAPEAPPETGGRMPEYTEQGAYVLAEKLGLPELNAQLLASFEGNGPIELSELANFYRSRPDLAPQADGIDGLMYLAHPLATDQDFFTYSPGTEMPERRALPEQVAFAKAWNLYYNYLVRHDPRFNQLPLSNNEQGDSMSEEDHIEHDRDNPALDMRTVLIGSPGGASNGPAFVNSNIRNVELEEAMVRFAHRLRFNNVQLVKYIIYDQDDLRDRVKDLGRLYTNNGRPFVIPSEHRDHYGHAHIALNLFSPIIDIPPRSQSSKEGARNATFDEVSTFNKEWYYQVFPHALKPGETPPPEQPTDPPPIEPPGETVELDDIVDDTEEPETTPAAEHRRLVEADRLAFVPDVWRPIAQHVQQFFPENDPLMGFAVIHTENRRYPEDPYAISPTSPDGARGWGQSMAANWLGRWGEVFNWGEDGLIYLDESQYGPHAAGVDMNGDGIRNPNDPYDSLGAINMTIPGTLNDPLANAGITGDPTKDIHTAVYEEGSETKLARGVTYNGGTQTRKRLNGMTLNEMAHNREQTSDYARMFFAYISTDGRFSIRLDETGPGFTWIDARTGDPVTEEFVRQTIVG